MLGPILATSHNLFFYADTMRAARAAIVGGEFEAWRHAFVDRYMRGDRESAARAEVET